MSESRMERLTKEIDQLKEAKTILTGSSYDLAVSVLESAIYSRSNEINELRECLGDFVMITGEKYEGCSVFTVSQRMGSSAVETIESIESLIEKSSEIYIQTEIDTEKKFSGDIQTSDIESFKLYYNEI